MRSTDDSLYVYKQIPACMSRHCTTCISKTPKHKDSFGTVRVQLKQIDALNKWEGVNLKIFGGGSLEKAHFKILERDSRLAKGPRPREGFNVPLDSEIYSRVKLD